MSDNDSLSFQEGITLIENAETFMEVTSVLNRWAAAPREKSFVTMIDVFKTIFGVTSLKPQSSSLASCLEVASGLFGPSDKPLTRLQLEELRAVLAAGFGPSGYLEGLMFDNFHPDTPANMPKTWFDNLNSLKLYAHHHSSTANELMSALKCYEHNNPYDTRSLRHLIVRKPDATVPMVQESVKVCGHDVLGHYVDTHPVSREELLTFKAKTLIDQSFLYVDVGNTKISEVIGDDLYAKGMHLIGVLVEETRMRVGEEFWEAFKNSWEGTLPELERTHQELS